MEQTFGKEQWVELFRKTGLTEAMMETWHQLFEAEFPDAHDSFLQWLQIPAAEIKEIRERFS